MLSRRLLKRCWTHATSLRYRSAISGTANQPREILGGDVCDMPAAADFSLIPAPRGLPVLGTTLALMKAGSSPQLHRYVDARHAELGPVYRESIGPVDAVFVCDPVEMRRVFQREGRYPKHLLPDAWILYNQLHGCKRGLFFM
ncbi:hypothetical protein B566_EDAN003511 [Ephemera danica]|nr:hypothetical protein B566_EDAN003511 [Ephemera danica]